MPDAVKVPPKPKYEHPLARFIGTRVVITLHHGGIIIEGELREVRDGTVYLEGSGIEGTKHRAIVGPLVLYIKDNISHVHGVPQSVEPIKKDKGAR